MTHRCPITYMEIPENQKYSSAGLRKLAPSLTELRDLAFTAESLRVEARKRASKMSIQGVQPKLSARLRPVQSTFEIVDRGGTFILKPPLELYREVPENEDLTMRLATEAGIEAPLHGMIYAQDGSRVYFIRRFDRLPRGQKQAVEDFAQLSGLTRDTKYNFSIERVVQTVEMFCTFPVIEKRKLWMRILFNFLTGNEDMHAKNYSLITRDGKVELAPAYDLLNTTLAVESAEEESALPLAGKKKRLKREDFLGYLAKDRMRLTPAVIEDGLSRLTAAFPRWIDLIRKSFLEPTSQAAYQTLLTERARRLGLAEPRAAGEAI
jgi:serine/threonine-protein kinase HipA